MSAITSFLLMDGIDYLLYGILLLSVYHLIMAINEKEITGRRVRKKVKSRLRKQVLEKKAEEIKNDSQKLSKLELMLRSTSKDPTKNPSVFGFILFCFLLGTSTFLLIFSRLGDLIISSGVGIFVFYIPYLYLSVKFNPAKKCF